MATRPVPSRHGRQRRPRWRCRRCGATSPWTWLGCGNGNGSLPGYDDQIKPLIESAAPDISAWMQPETKDVDLAPVERMWNGLGLDPLPEGFDWPLVARNYARAIRRHVKKDPNLRAMLDIALQEEIADSVGRLAGPSPGFDLPGYRDFLRKK